MTVKKVFASRARLQWIILLSIFACASLRAAQVSLAWNPSSSPAVAGYYLFYGLASGHYTAHVDSGASSDVTVAGLTAGVSYYFAVKAYESDGDQSPFSNEVIVKAAATAASAASAGTTHSATAQGHPLVQATSNPYPFAAEKGIYNGLFSTTNGASEETAGMLQGLSVGPKGAYTGTLIINGGRHAISGRFNSAGQATNYISRLASRGGRLMLQMTLSDPGNGQPEVTGTVSGTNWTADLFAVQAANSLRSAQYTMLIPPDTNSTQSNPSPGGDGHALIANHAGTARVTGTLADGASFSQTVPVSETGYVPLFANLYANQGLLTGWINLDLTNTAGVSLTWIHPACASGAYRDGFTNVLYTDEIQLSRVPVTP